MNTQIFYGAGEWIDLNYSAIRKLGFLPTCFIDDDLAKQNTTVSFGKRHIDTYEVLSPIDAMKKYPGCEILLTVHPDSWAEKEKKLLQSSLVKKEQIISYPKHLKITRGCYDMQKRMEVRPTLAYCCTAMVDGEDTIPLDLDHYEKTIEDFYAVRNRDIEALKSGNTPKRCKGCPNNVVDLWFDRPVVETVAVALAGLCQLNCIYCGGTDRTEWDVNELSKNFKLGEFLTILKEKNLIDRDADIVVASGEPALHPMIEEWLTGTDPYYCEVLTNAARFSEPIMNLLIRGHSDIFVSLDAGTRQTFKKVKGADMWEKVCENLEKYTASGGKVMLKYILLPGINDNIEDADGFLEFASRIKTPSISISSNLFELNENTRLPEQTIETARYLLRSAKGKGLKSELLKIFFSTHDCALIISGVDEAIIGS